MEEKSLVKMNGNVQVLPCEGEHGKDPGEHPEGPFALTLIVGVEDPPVPGRHGCVHDHVHAAVERFDH
ncbi:MAG: hypothetical protein ACP5U2_13050, partial [Bryobacteraceae bacterium]